MIGKSALCACLLIGAVTAAAGQSLQEKVDKCKSGDPDTSITACTTILQEGLLTMLLSNEHLSAVYYNRGNAYSRKGNYDRAIQDFDQAVRLNPNDPDIYYVRGRAYFNKGDYDPAIQDFDQATHLNPNYALAYLDRGNAYRDKGDYDRAIQDLNEAIHLNQKYAATYFARGQAYLNKYDYDSAIQDFNEAIRLSPNEVPAYFFRAIAYYYKGDYDHAIQNYNEAIRLDPKFALAYKKRGDAFFAASKLTAAIADFEQSISVAPSSTNAVFAALPLHVAMKRQGHEDAQQLERVAAVADLSKWPGPILKLDLGQMTADEVMKAAISPDSDKAGLLVKWHVCDANYFTGEDALFHHQRATALTRLRAARDGCPKAASSYGAALAELKRLGATAVAGK